MIGRVYEYFLQVYAASGTKEDGEFYTPACVVKLIAEMIEPFSGRFMIPAVVLEACSCNRINLWNVIRATEQIFLSLVRKATRIHGDSVK